MPSLILHQRGKQYTIPLALIEVTIGRSKGNKIRLDWQPVSRTHCKIVPAGETYKLIDLESGNRTYVNDRPVGEHFLNHGDSIAVADIILIFENENQRPPKKSGSKPKRNESQSTGSGDPDDDDSPTLVGFEDYLKKVRENAMNGK